MKKIFATAAFFASIAMSVLAQDDEVTYRRTWDFTKGWSQETIDKLNADPTNWEVQSTGFQNITAQTANQTPWVVVDGEKEPIAELVGITVNSNNAKAKHVQICTTGSGLADVPCYWMNGKGDAISVKVPAGENVKFGYTAHGAQDRGYSCNSGFADANGATKWTDPDNQTIHEVELINSNKDSESTLTLTTQNGGCHIYYIIIGEGDKEEEKIEETPRVAYLYDATYNGAKDADKNPCGWLANGGLDEDPVYNVLQSFETTAIDYSTVGLSSAELNDSLMKFDVVVVGEAVSSSNALAKGLVEIINKVPVLNLKSFMYKNTVWNFGAGVNPNPKATAVKVAVDYAEDPLFDGVTVSEDSLITLFEVEDVTAINGNLVQGYTAAAGSVFEEDEVIATVSGANAIHAHGTKNRYMLIPISSDNMNMLSGDAQTLVYNAITVLAKTKSNVQKTATPTIAQKNENLYTEVTLACRTAGSSIYYTIDGSAPTTANTLYAEPFKIEQDSVLVRAIAVAHGYNTSDTASAYIRVFSKLNVPVITIQQGEGYATITMEPAQGEEANIYYAFTEVTDKSKASVYSGPIVVTDASTVYAFAEWATAVQSETTSMDFVVGGAPAVKDTVAHFLPNVTSWGDSSILYHADTLVGGWNEAVAAGLSVLSSSAYYNFGKSATSNLSTEIDHIDTIRDEEGNIIKSLLDPTQDSTKVTYKIDPSVSFKLVSPLNPGWEILSEGQVVTFEKSAPAYYIGNGAADRCPESAIDMITGGPQCKGLMDFGAKASGCSYNLRVQTAEKVAAPFYVETYLGNGSTNNNCDIAVEVSADGEEWTKIQDLTISETQRYWRRHKVHFAEAGEYLVRIAQHGNTSKAQLYDVLIITTEGTTGIEAVNANANNHSDNRIFDLQGREVSKMVPGQLYIKNGKKVIVK